MEMETDPEVGATEGAECPPAQISKANRGKTIIALLGVALATIAALAIGLGVYLSNKEPSTHSLQDDNNSANTTQILQDETDIMVNEKALNFDTMVNKKALNFDINIQPFSPDILTGYSDCNDLEADIEMALKFDANKIIEEQSERDCATWYGDWWFRGDGPSFDPSKEKETSFGTNNQVGGVEEADPIQSDGTHIFMAYGNEIIVIDLQGNVITKEEVPSPVVEKNDSLDTTMEAQPRSIMPPRGSEKISISSLLLNRNRVVALAHKYNYESEGKVLGGTTTAFIYEFNISSDTPFTLVHQKQITGLYQSARAIDNHAHVVTSARFNTWGFTSTLNRCMNKMYTNMTNEEYFAAATAIASDVAFDYAASIMGELFKDENKAVPSCQHIVQINSMMSGSKSGMESAMTKRGNFYSHHSGILDSFHQVTSFDFTADAASLGTTTSRAGAFMNQGNVEAYASGSNLVLAGRGWRYNEDSSHEEYTMLMGFALNGAEAKPIAVGEVTGYLLNSYSLDWWDGHLRVATTNSQNVSMETGEVTSPSTSQVTILEYDGQEMAMTGQVTDLGVGEIIYSTCFLEDKAFVVTFQQVDPLYAIDLRDHRNPVKRGEVKITGFSNYMKFVQGNYLLTVGQEAEENTGRPTGLKISLFDVANLDKPDEHDKYVEQSRSHSSAQYDFHAFRYLEGSKRLIIPVSMYRDWENPYAVQFDGFRVYDVDAANKIGPSASVTHANDENWNWCYSRNRLPSRSMVFDNKLVTFKGHTVLMSDDIETPQTVWDLNLDQDRYITRSQCFEW